MKKIIILFMCFYQISAFSFTKGFKGGINYTIPQVQGSDWDKYSGDFGFNVSAFATVYLDNYYYLTSEVMLSRISFSYTYSDLENNITKSDDTCTSMDFALSFNRNFNKNYYFSFGAFFGFPFEHKITHKVNEDKPHTFSLNEEHLEFSYGLLTGITYKTNNFTFDARYLVNFSTLIDKDAVCYSKENDTSCTIQLFHQIQILAGFEF